MTTTHGFTCVKASSILPHVIFYVCLTLQECVLGVVTQYTYVHTNYKGDGREREGDRVSQAMKGAQHTLWGYVHPHIQFMLV